MTSFYFITITKYSLSINEWYIPCSWFSWTFTNSNIKQVVLHVKNSFTWTKQNNSKNKNKLLNKIITKNKHKLNIVISKIKSSKISINKQNYKNNYLGDTIYHTLPNTTTHYHTLPHTTKHYHTLHVICCYNVLF